MSEVGLVKVRLIALRQSREWKQLDVASMLSLTLEEYQSIESGKEKVSGNLAIKLSEIYKIPLGLFLEAGYSERFSVIFSHCNFLGGNGYVNNLYQGNERIFDTIHASKDEQILLLENEVHWLRNQNDQLIACLIQHLHNRHFV